MEMTSFHIRFRILDLLCCLCFLLFSFFAERVQAEDKPFGISKRIPWTTSRLTGSPDPPLPYTIVRAFPKLTFKNPLLLTNAPGTERPFIRAQAGTPYSLPNDAPGSHADLYLDVTTRSNTR